MMKESGKNAFGVPYYEILTKVDQLSMEWIEAEAKRTGLSPETIATAMVRRMCAEKMTVGIAKE